MKTKHLVAAAAVVIATWFLIGTSAENTDMSNLSATLRTKLSLEGEMPSLDSTTAWLNSSPLRTKELHGKVVLIQFWTYTCINWWRTLPYVRAWASKYQDQGLVVIGVHTPEFSFEQDVDNVRRALQEQGVDYPVAIDNGYAIWRAFGNHYWPALYLVDAQGRIRHHHFGEGDYERSERIIQQLLADAGHAPVDRTPVSVDARGAEVAADWQHLRSPETYLGHARNENFASLENPALDKPRAYVAPARLRLNEWALSGTWTMHREYTVLNKPNGRVAYRFHARDLHLVMGTSAPDQRVRFRVLIDGQPPATSRGEDVDEQGVGTIAAPRMYQLIRQKEAIVERHFEIEFLDPGARVFAFTFG